MIILRFLYLNFLSYYPISLEVSCVLWGTALSYVCWNLKFASMKFYDAYRTRFTYAKVALFALNVFRLTGAPQPRKLLGIVRRSYHSVRKCKQYCIQY